MVIAKLFSGLSVLALASISLAGCAAEANDGDDMALEEQSGDLSAAGKGLIGSYRDDSGAFKHLVLTSTKAGQRNVFQADVDTGVRCIKAPCPSSEHIEGTFTAGTKTITLYSTTASGFSQHLLGKYDYLVQGSKLSLSRKGFAQSLAKDADIWPADATKLVAKMSGGFMPLPPPGSTCTNGEEYSLDNKTRKLTFKRCDFNGSKPRHPVTGVVTLTAARVASIDAAMNGLQVANDDICGADKPFQTLTVTTPAGAVQYTDSFYGCRGGSDVYVDNIGGVFSALRAASGK